MLKRLDDYVERYESIVRELSDPNIVNDLKKMTSLAKEQRAIEKIVFLYKDYLKNEQSLSELKEMKKDDDDEIAQMAAAEYDLLIEEQKRLEDELKVLLLPKDPDDDKNVIIEIRGAAGGDEGNIFAGDLYRMYYRYAESRGWKVDLLNDMPSDMGGFTLVEFMISGENVYSFLKYESGAHRVQRVPTTEAQGRIHTSTATVLVVPEASEIEFELNMNDVRVDTFCSSGPGGQSVNTTKSAVRVTHEPTGMSVACQSGKSQHENKQAALALLKTRMYDKMVQDREEKDGQRRQELIGHGDRSEKIRTYNYPQNRVTDHRINFTIQRLDAVIDGKLDLVITEILHEVERRKLSGEEF